MVLYSRECVCELSSNWHCPRWLISNGRHAWKELSWYSGREINPIEPVANRSDLRRRRRGWWLCREESVSEVAVVVVVVVAVVERLDDDDDVVEKSENEGIMHNPLMVEDWIS